MEAIPFLFDTSSGNNCYMDFANESKKSSGHGDQEASLLRLYQVNRNFKSLNNVESYFKISHVGFNSAMNLKIFA